MLALMLILHTDWRKRMSSFVILAVSSFTWVIAWSIRNRVIGGTATNRVLGWHPIKPSNWALAVDTLLEFLLPVSRWRREVPDSIFIVVLLLMGFAILLWTLYKGLPKFLKPAQVDMPDILPLTNSLYIVAYLLALITTMTLFDPATKFQVRILSPVYIPVILLAATLVTWLWNHKHNVWKPTIILLVSALFGTFSYGLSISLPDIQNAPGFASVAWREAKSIAALREYPADVLILTNEPGLVYFQAGHPAGVLPRPDEDLTKLKQAVLDGKVVIALFRVNVVDEEKLTFYYKLASGLYRREFARTWILSGFPTQETK